MRREQPSEHMFRRQHKASSDEGERKRKLRSELRLVFQTTQTHSNNVSLSTPKSTSSLTSSTQPLPQPSWELSSRSATQIGRNPVRVKLRHPLPTVFARARRGVSAGLQATSMTTPECALKIDPGRYTLPVTFRSVVVTGAGTVEMTIVGGNPGRLPRFSTSSILAPGKASTNACALLLVLLNR